MTTAQRANAHGLRRSLGWPAVAAYGLGAILGAGIYSVIGVTAGHVGEAMWLAFAASAVVALLTALSYAELATMFPRAGAEFIYVRNALPRYGSVPFVVGLMMVASAAATAATVAFAFGGYLASMLDVPTVLVAPLLLGVLAAVAIAGVKESAGMVAVFTALEALGLVLVIIAGATSEHFGEALAAAPTPEVFSGAALVFFAYLGFENIANLAEETKEPEKNLPRAILISLAVATVLYILVALAAVALMPAPELAQSGAPLADAVRGRSSSLAGALGGIALFATANTALAGIVSGSRMLYAMANHGELPARVGAVLPKRRTPWIATLVVVGLALALLPLGSVAIVASLSSFASLVAFAAINVALIVLRYRKPDQKRPFRVPGAIGNLPVLPLVGAIATTALLTQLDSTAILCGVGLAVTLLVTYVALGRSRRRAVHR